MAPPWAEPAATRSSSSGLQWRGILGSLNSSGAVSVSSVTQEMHLPFRGPAEPRKWGPRGSDGAFSGSSGCLVSLPGTLSTEVKRVPLLGWQSEWQGGEGRLQNSITVRQSRSSPSSALLAYFAKGETEIPLALRSLHTVGC